MIIECEKCKSRFNLDESLLKQEGSKVKCSTCENVFVAYPSEPTPVEGPPPDESLDEAFEETVALDSPPVLEEEAEPEVEPEAEPEAEAEPTEEEIGADFDMAFDEGMEEETVQTMSPDQIPEEEEMPDGEEVMERAAEIGEQLTEDEPEEEFEEEPEEGDEAVPSEKEPGRSMLFPVILGIVLLLLGGAVAVIFLAPDLIPDSLSFIKQTKKEEPADMGNRRLSFKAVTGSFIESDNAGQLFVIKGMVTNKYPKGRSFILTKGSLLDDKGRVVKKKMAYAGNTFTENQIKEMSLEEIDKGLKNRLGKGRVNFNIKPDGTIPFMIVFSGLPDNLSEFTVEAVSSSPGT
jgi:predicted Zn finger-like uncharacterized protein